MNDPLLWISAISATCGCFFFVAGSIGLLRLPDIYSRLHALTKADGLGLGLVVLAAMLQQEHWIPVIKLGMVWLLILFTGASVSLLTARTALETKVPWWRKEEA